jgi:hypothetical protein
MDPQQAQAMQLIQQLAAQDPEIQTLQQKSQFKQAIHEHTSRCWEKCNLAKEAQQSSLSSGAKSCLDNCVRNFFECQAQVTEFVQKRASKN